MDLGIKIALGLDGFSEDDIALIEAAIPAAERLLNALKANEPDLLAVIPAAKLILQHAKGTTS